MSELIKKLNYAGEEYSILNFSEGFEAPTLLYVRDLD